MTTCSTASKTFSQEVRNASAVSLQESRRAQRARNSIYALVRVRLPSPQGNFFDDHGVTPAAVQASHRVQREDEESPQRDELKAPFGELVVAARRLIAARTDRLGTLARPNATLDTLLVGAEAGVLIDESPEVMAAV